ncbi:MAG TPA: Mth938-like domain-containing protein [Gammaproteobacteria bacterium]|nr:Mth938-like domain-containing protein [Gammaproteobacteria bacterium]
MPLRHWRPHGRVDLVSFHRPAYGCRMRFSQDFAATHTIRAYREGEIVINDKTIRHSVIVTPDTIQPWAPRSMAELEQAHFAAFEALHPEVVIVGTGRQLQFPPPRFSVDLLARGIGVEVMTNDAACRTFNILLSEDRQVLLALLLG